MYALFSLIGLGFDSFLASLVIGSYAWSGRERLRLALAFGGCDAVAALVGQVWPHRFAEPPTLAIYLGCVFLLAVAARTSRIVLYALPVLLSIDNLFSGGPASMVPALGASSALMALLGLSLTALVRNNLALSESEA